MATVELMIARHVEHRAVECLPGPLNAPHAEVDIARQDDDISFRHLRREEGELVVQVGERVNSHREYLSLWLPVRPSGCAARRQHVSMCKICTYFAARRAPRPVDGRIVQRSSIFREGRRSKLERGDPPGPGCRRTVQRFPIFRGGVPSWNAETLQTLAVGEPCNTPPYSGAVGVPSWNTEALQALAAGEPCNGSPYSGGVGVPSWNAEAVQTQAAGEPCNAPPYSGGVGVPSWNAPRLSARVSRRLQPDARRPTARRRCSRSRTGTRA